MPQYDKPPGPGERLNTNYNYPGPLALVKIVKERYPNLRFNGLYAPRPVGGTNTPSAHQVARGVDFSQDNATAKAEAENCFYWLVSVADKVQLQGAIFDHKIWGFGDERIRQTHPNGNPHTDHIHFEQNIAGAKLTEQQIRERLNPPNPPPPLSMEDDMTPDLFELAGKVYYVGLVRINNDPNRRELWWKREDGSYVRGGGVFTTGISVKVIGGQARVVGRGGDGALWQGIFDPNAASWSFGSVGGGFS